MVVEGDLTVMNQAIDALEEAKVYLAEVARYLHDALHSNYDNWNTCPMDTCKNTRTYIQAWNQGRTLGAHRES